MSFMAYKTVASVIIYINLIRNSRVRFTLHFAAFHLEEKKINNKFINCEICLLILYFIIKWGELDQLYGTILEFTIFTFDLDISTTA